MEDDIMLVEKEGCERSDQGREKLPPPVVMIELVFAARISGFGSSIDQWLVHFETCWNGVSESSHDGENSAYSDSDTEEEDGKEVSETDEALEVVSDHVMELSDAKLPNYINILDDEDNYFIQPINYGWRLDHCMICKVFSHSQSTCQASRERRKSDVIGPQSTSAANEVLSTNFIPNSSMEDDIMLVEKEGCERSDQGREKLPPPVVMIELVFAARISGFGSSIDQWLVHFETCWNGVSESKKAQSQV
ncbi:hypothetical protein NE237_008668 [Protea cynaroides]|uniref:Uncharacterized protein n=1 Tax=Protea cynaroides TaxID=273540 RepID=A0A9Q0KVZ8_9MAGN|nr:hypothetical protein NE237_008668 [Protea cynaroides]